MTARAAPLAMLLALAACGGSVKRTDIDPMWAAVLADNPARIAALLAAGADVNAKTNVGSVPLEIAIATGKPAATRFLLQHGADVNAGPNGGRSVLMAACQHAPDLVPELIAKGAAVNYRARDGRSALLDCASTGDLAAVKALVAAGADLHATPGSLGGRVMIEARGSGVIAYLAQRYEDEL